MTALIAAGLTVVVLAGHIADIGLGPAVRSWSVQLGLIGSSVLTVWGLARNAGHRNRLLPVLLCVGISGALAMSVIVVAHPLADLPPGVLLLDVPPAELPRPAAYIVALDVVYLGAVVPLLTYGLLLFPDGALPSPRWRRVVPVVPVVGLLMVASELELLWPTREVAYADGGATPLSDIAWPLFLATVALSCAALVVRYRRADGQVRLQIRWLLLGAAVMVVALLSGPAGGDAVVTTVGLAVFFAAYGVAVLRYRLYDIDVVINRTLVFLALAAFITGIYAAIVVGIGSMAGDPSNPVLAVGATAVVAVVFEPVRLRVQHWANIVAYGRRATPYEVLAGFADQLRQPALDPEQQVGELARLLVDGTGADRAVVWLADDGTLTPVEVAPDGRAFPERTAAIDALPAAAAAPVVLDGELLGAVSIDARRGGEVSDSDRRLLDELAGQAALVLGNARLRAQLQQRMVALTDSRRRLVAATDEARRRLERDLHDGAQQQLVALKVKLGLVRTLAGREAADALVPAIGDIADEADAAIEGLRELARGIYPPLLESEGLAVALEAQARKLPLPVVVAAGDVGRHPRPIEACVYFCAVEALGNVMRHAAATVVRLSVTNEGGTLAFAVGDDGTGFDPAVTPRGGGLLGMADRLDTVGGGLAVDATPGGGTTVRGSIPVLSPV